MLENYIEEYNKAAFPKKRLEIIEKLFHCEAAALCIFTDEVIKNLTQYKQLMMDVWEFYGHYEIIEKVKNIIIAKVKADELHYFSNFKAYFKQTCLNVMRDMAKSKAFKDQQRIYYLDAIHDYHISVDLPLPEEIPPEDCLKNIYSTYLKMCNALNSGKLENAARQLQFYKKRLKHCKGSEAEIALLQAIMFHFRAHIHMHKGRFKAAQPFLHEAIQYTEWIGEFKPHFSTISKNLLAETLFSEKKINEGSSLLSDMISSLEDNPRDPHLKSEKIKSCLLLAKYTSFTNPKKAYNILQSIPRSEFSLKTEFAMYNAEIYYHLHGSGKTEKTQRILEQWDEAIKSAPYQEETGFERFRWYANSSQAYLHNFKTRDEENIEKARSYILKMQSYEDLSKSKLWNFYIEIHKGYIEKNKQMMYNGVWGLKKVFPITFDWYREKLKDVTF